MSTNLGVHDTETCNTANGQSCGMCSWVDDLIVRRELDEWDLERELSNFQERYGTEALAQKLSSYMVENGIY